MKFEWHPRKARSNKKKHDVSFFVSLAPVRQQRKSVKTMKEMYPPETNNQEGDLLPEYNFDYRKARPNRFALKDEQRVVILDPDVAEIFKTSESVNEVLRALIATMPKAE